MKAMRINLTAWQNLLRGIFDAGPFAGSRAVVSLHNHVLGGARELRAKLAFNALSADAVMTWDNDATAANLRVSAYVAHLGVAADMATPELAAEYLRVNVADPLLRGVFPPSWWALVPSDVTGIHASLARRGVRFDAATGVGRILGGDASLVASLWNQVVAASDVPGTTWAPDWLAATISGAAVQMRESGPGEDPTATDAVITALSTAATGASRVFEAIGGARIAWIVGGAALALLLVLWAWRTR